jgi:hypothetical protein
VAGVWDWDWPHVTGVAAMIGAGAAGLVETRLALPTAVGSMPMPEVAGAAAVPWWGSGIARGGAL